MDNTSIAIIVATASAILAAAVIYLKSKSSPLVISATGDSGDEAIPAWTLAEVSFQTELQG